MSFASKWSTNRFNIKYPDSKKIVYTNLADLYQEDDKATYQILALYLNKKGKFDDNYNVQINESTIVSLPSNLTDQIKRMMEDEETIGYINDGTAGFTIRKYYSEQYGKTCYSVNWCDYKK